MKAEANSRAGAGVGTVGEVGGEMAELCLVGK